MYLTEMTLSKFKKNLRSIPVDSLTEKHNTHINNSTRLNLVPGFVLVLLIFKIVFLQQRIFRQISTLP